MIIEFILGALVSFIFLLLFKTIGYFESINKWILATSKFIYISGHPLLDDETIYQNITKRFKGVFLGVMSVLLKTVLIVIILLTLIALSSIVISKTQSLENIE